MTTVVVAFSLGNPKPHFSPQVWKGGASAPPFRQPPKSVQTR